jgi:4-hydroxyacetophenone monooxygenase
MIGPELAQADDAWLQQAVQDAELPALLTALAMCTGDTSILRPELRPPLSQDDGLPPAQGGMSPEAQAQARAIAFEALRRYRDAGSPAPVVDDARLRNIMSFITGEVHEDYGDLLRHEMALPRDHGRPSWSKEAIAPDRPFFVVIIGAGMAGIVAAHRLAQAGVRFVVLERNSDVGGVWFENQYPGCRLDTSNFAYSYTFAQRDDWPHFFSTQDEVRSYLAKVVDDQGLRPRIEFETNVQSAVFDETSRTWHVTAQGLDGTRRFEAQAVISAVGQLNEPNFPAIPGLDTFAGPSLHTARWQPDVDLEGRRVAFIGTGASGYQAIPELAADVSHLSIFQRSSPWAVPAARYHYQLPDGLAWLFRRVPYYHRWYRFYQFWTAVEGRRPYAEVDPAWQTPGSVSDKNELLRKRLIEHLSGQYEDRPDLLAKVIPDYPPFAKRMLMDNGIWAHTLHRDNVDLVTDRIKAVTPTGIVTDNGELHPCDVIVYGTGFRASEFLSSMSVIGRSGIRLQDQWHGDARAYLGINIPNFPNLFCLYGPNTNLVVNGSLVLFAECAVEYVLESIRQMLVEEYDSLEIRGDVCDRYNEEIDAANRGMAWGVDNVDSWYKNKFGRVSQNWPLTTIEYWRRTHNFDRDLFIRVPSNEAPVDRSVDADDVHVGAVPGHLAQA